MKFLDFKEDILNKKILESKDLDNDIIFRKYNISVGDIVKIKENQIVCIIEKGKILDINDKIGTYVIEDIDNEELDDIWKNFIIRKSEDEELCIIFINSNVIKHNKYNISNRIKYDASETDKKLEIMLEGYYDFKIVNPKNLLSQVIGLRKVFTKQELIEKVREHIINSIVSGINVITNEYKLDVDFSNLSDDGYVEGNLKSNQYDEKLFEYGIKLLHFEVTKYDIYGKKSNFF